MLERLAGTYEVNKDTAIVVTRQDTQLTMSVVHPGREHSYALFAGSPTEFFAKSVDSDLAFQLGPGGAVEGLKFRMASETRPAKKVKSRLARGQTCLNEGTVESADRIPARRFQTPTLAQLLPSTRSG